MLIRTALLFRVMGLAFMCVLSGCGSPSGDAEAGRRWYAMVHCDACHGEEGRGGKGPPALAGTNQGYDQFRRKVRRAGDGIMPSTGLEVLSDQQLADMHAFLRGLPPVSSGR